MFRTLGFIIGLTVILAGCASQSLKLSPAELNSIRIVGIDFVWAQGSTTQWAEADERFKARVAADPELAAVLKPKRVAYANATDDEHMKSALSESAVTGSPQAEQFRRTEVEALLTRTLNGTVLSEFAGTRAMRLKVVLTNFAVPSIIQRALIGGQPIMGAKTSLVDAETGEVVGEMDRAAAAFAGSGYLVVLDVAQPDHAQSLAMTYAGQVRAWLKRQ